MAEKHSVAMFADVGGNRTQVGWASPAKDGVRTFEFSPGYENVRVRDVTFSDEEEKALAAEAVRVLEGGTGSTTAADAREDLGLEAPRVDAAPDESKAAEPVDNVGEDEDTVELNSGGDIVEVVEDEESEEAAFERELAEEKAASKKNKKNQESDND
jgi:hypothetical protein